MTLPSKPPGPLPLDEQRVLAETRPRVPGAPSDLLDAVSRAAGVPRGTAARVLVSVSNLGLGINRATDEAERDLGQEVRVAIAVLTRRLRAMWQVGRAAAAAETVEVPVSVLITPEPAEAMCRGCPDSLPCVQQGLSTPQVCRAGRFRRVEVTVLRATGTDLRLRCAHPVGEYDVELDVLISAMTKEAP